MKSNVDLVVDKHYKDDSESDWSIQKISSKIPKPFRCLVTVKPISYPRNK